MKNIKYLLIILFVLFLPIKVLAKGSISVSTTKISVVKGSYATFKVVASGASGNVNLTNSNSEIASLNTSSFWIENESVTIKIKALKVGSTTLTIKLSNASTDDFENLKGTYTVVINVKETSEENAENDVETNTSKALNTASLLVEACEKSLDESDYKAALEYTDALDESNSKTALLDRLEKVKSQIDDASGETNEDVCICESDNCIKNNKLYIILIILLFSLAILEGSYITYILAKKGRD